MSDNVKLPPGSAALVWNGDGKGEWRGFILSQPADGQVPPEEMLIGALLVGLGEEGFLERLLFWLNDELGIFEVEH